VCFNRAQHERRRDSGVQREIDIAKALRKMNRVPAWTDRKAMRDMYKDAYVRRARGEDVEVDHIVPIRSELVSGLHVPANLQIIDSGWNNLKRNEWWPDMP
jgi:hypothetical protein